MTTSAAAAAAAASSSSSSSSSPCDPMDRIERRPWSELPPEILSMIGRRLHTRMDVVRFRSVCSSFRSSITPPPRHAARFPFPIPHSRGYSVFLCESTICILETPPDEAPDSGSRSPPRCRWLVKLQESSLGDVQLLSLFSQRRITYLPRNFPKVIDSLGFRIAETCREYRLEYGSSGIVPGIRKVVVSPDCVWTDIDKLEVYSIVEDGRLAYWKYGDENWTYLEDQHGCSYDDIIAYEGKVCVVDWSGTVSLMDSSIRTKKFSPSICSDSGSSGNFKHLVVFSGDLYVVDRYFSGNLGGYENDAYIDDIPYPSFKETFDFRVYRLDRQCGKWAEVRSLGNMAFFLSKHCSYAISMHELGGCNGNCIYFMENTDSPYSRDEVNVFSLEDGSIKSLVFSDFLMSTWTSSDLTQPKLMPLRSEEFAN